METGTKSNDTKGVRARVREARFASAGILLLLVAWASSSRAAEPISDRLTFSGYGDIHYNNPRIDTMDRSAPSEADVHRLVLGWAYEFQSDIHLEVEVDFEHAAKAIELELAHLDYDLNPRTTLRAG